MCSKCDRRRFLRATAGLLGAGGAVLLGGCPENQSAPPITTPTDPTTSTGEVPVTTASGGDGKVGINKIIGHPLDGIEAVIAQTSMELHEAAEMERISLWDNSLHGWPEPAAGAPIINIAM